MRHQQKIYNQNGNFVRNRDLLNVNMSSDFCVFTSPTFDVSGATKVETGTTSASTGVYIVDNDDEDITLTFNFTGNTSTFDDSSIFKYEIYKYHHSNGVFTNPATYKSADITYDTFSATSAVTATISVGDLSIDGDYLIKGYYVQDVCTDILSRLGLTNDTSLYKKGSEYDLYAPLIDYYFVVCEKAEIPQLTHTLEASQRPLGSLIAFSILPTGQTEFNITTNVEGALLVYLNGLLLAEKLDYTFTGTILQLSGATITGDILTYVSVANETTNGLIVDNIDINKAIVSGVTDGEGSETVYYNTTTSKYETFTTLTPVSGNDIVVTLNGVTLAPNIDFYQSISNPKRIIFTGILLVDDIINIVYNAWPAYVGNIFTNTPTIYWSVPAPELNNGIFTVQVATDSTFGTIVTTATTNYVGGQSGYNAELTITGAVGTQMVYRVCNEKNYKTVVDDTITTNAYSEVVPITIMSNAINSY